jgi:RNA polymerase sigma-70 factor (ECF subfamily)
VSDLPPAAIDGDERRRWTALVDGVREGSAAALQELMDGLWGELVRFAARELGDLDGARDIVQGAFVYVWEHRASWVPSGSPRAYLYRVVRNAIIDEHRRVRVRRDWAERERASPPATVPDPDEQLAAGEVERAFENAVAALPDRRRAAFSLVVLGGLSHAEAAETLGISRQTVANQVSHALADVREALRTVIDPDEPEEW